MINAGGFFVVYTSAFHIPQIGLWAIS